MRQSKVDKLYAGLKDLAEERRGKLDERHRLFQLNREVDDLEQWIAGTGYVCDGMNIYTQSQEACLRTWLPYGEHRITEQGRPMGGARFCLCPS